MSPSPQFTAEQKRRAVSLFEYGEDPNNIARRFGCSVDALRRWARAAGVSRPNGNAAPLTAAATHEAYTRWAAGSATLEELASEHGYQRESFERLMRRAHKSFGDGELPGGRE